MAEKSTHGDEEFEPMQLDGRHIVMTPTGVTFLLNEADQEQARKCLERSGKITIDFGEITVSSLNEIRKVGRFGGRLAPDGGTGPAPGPGPID
jgi:hypothetical protein